MREYLNKMNTWLLPTLLILFILQVVTLPFMVNFTYAGRSEQVEHILTYTPNRLRWNTSTGINDQGVAQIALFDAKYTNVESKDGRHIVAPGTEGASIIRLHNDAPGMVEFMAVLYRIDNTEKLPVEVNMAVSGKCYGVTNLLLPKGVTEDQVLYSMRGLIGHDEIRDFDITWNWDFENGSDQDTMDTMLGSKEELDEITVGLYIVVEDKNEYTLPKTGDDSRIGMYLALMAISGGLLILLFWERRKERKCAA